MRNQNNAFHLAVPCKDLQETLIEGEKTLGIHPEFNRLIKIKKGRYGLYLELESEEKGEIKRSAIPRNKSAESINLEEAVEI